MKKHRFGLSASLVTLLIVAALPNIALAQNASKDEIKEAKKFLPQYLKRVHAFESGTPDANIVFEYRVVAKYQTALGDYASAIENANKGLMEISKTPEANISETLSLLMIRAKDKEYLAKPKREIYDDYLAIYRNAGFFLSNAHVYQSSVYGELKPIGSKLDALSGDLYFIDLNADFAAHPENKPIYESAIAKMNAGDHAGAVAEYSRAIANSPNFYLYYVARAYQESAIKNRDAAIADIKKSIALSGDAENGWVYKGLGYEYYYSGKYSQAFNEVETALKKNPWDTNLRISRSNFLADIEKQAHPKAFEKYQSGLDKIAKAKASDFSLRNEIYASAISDLNEAIKLSPNAAMYYNPKIEASIAQYPTTAEPNSIINAAKKAYQLDAESISNLYSLGKVYWYYGWSQGEDSGNLNNSLRYLYTAALWAPDDQAIPKQIASAEESLSKGSYEHQAQVAADNARAAAQREKDEQAQQEAAKYKTPDFNDKMQAWCDSIGASNITIMAAVPPVCFGYIHK